MQCYTQFFTSAKSNGIRTEIFNLHSRKNITQEIGKLVMTYLSFESNRFQDVHGFCSSKKFCICVVIEQKLKKCVRFSCKFKVIAFIMTTNESFLYEQKCIENLDKPNIVFQIFSVAMLCRLIVFTSKQSKQKNMCLSQGLETMSRFLTDTLQS